jgi:hypothetical protein
MQEHHSQASHAPASQPTQRIQCIQGREAPFLSHFEFDFNVINVCKAGRAKAMPLSRLLVKVAFNGCKAGSSSDLD